MTEAQKINLLGKLVTGSDLNKQLPARKNSYDFTSIHVNKPELIREMIQEGWEEVRSGKSAVRLRKLKPLDIQCEDQVWTLFALMGFRVMNRDRQFNLPYDLKKNLTQQIDVFAKDDETVIIVECKSAQKNKLGEFKKDLEATSSQIDGLMKTIQALFPNENLKFKYILATKNYYLGDEDKKRLRHLNGTHLDEEAIEYYINLYKHLGDAARYQLLGSLFEGRDIEGMDNRIPAIKGKMGNQVYYSFSIEPEKLLKIGYVLHRSKVNSELMPTYQRLIKKSRLTQIHEFIDEKSGYFPNSIVISLDTQGKDLRFDQAGTQVSTTLTSVGVLHLPKRYRSAYVIDGQHRLYGYSNSKFKSKNSIPVVAFLDLDQNEQVRLFMEINENQKSVPKNLRTTLNADLLWNSTSYVDKQKALCSRIALSLGESRHSPLYGMVSIGEDTKIITTDTITRSLMNGSFIGKATKNKIEELGSFYQGDLNRGYDQLTNYLFLSIGYLKEQLDSSWFEADSLIVINKGIYAIIRLLSDIIEHLTAANLISSNTSPKDKFSESKRFLDAVINFYNTVDQETSEDLRKKYGQSGDIAYWRRLQKEVRLRIKQFQPGGLDDYEQREAKEYNEEAYKTIRDIEQFLNTKFKELLHDNFGEAWFETGVPPKIQDDAVLLAQQKKRDEKRFEVHPWECMRIINYKAIALRNWASIFANVVTLAGDEKIAGGKEAKTEWMQKVGQIRNQNMHSYSVTKDELEFLRRVKRLLISKVD